MSERRRFIYRTCQMGARIRQGGSAALLQPDQSILVSGRCNHRSLANIRGLGSGPVGLSSRSGCGPRQESRHRQHSLSVRGVPSVGVGAWRWARRRARGGLVILGSPVGGRREDRTAAKSPRPG